MKGKTMSAEPLTRSEVFGQLRRELYGEERSTDSNTHIFIILGASVSPLSFFSILKFRNRGNIAPPHPPKLSREKKKVLQRSAQVDEAIWGRSAYAPIFFILQINTKEDKTYFACASELAE